MASGSRIGRWMFYGVISVIALFFIGALAMPWLQRDAKDYPGRAFSGINPGDKHHPVTVRQATGKALVATGETEAHGQAVMVACATCHDTRDPDFSISSGPPLDEFHQGLRYQHGGLTCLSCHNSDDYNTLRLADGQSLDFSGSMRLCAQCHGPQHRDYQNGSHGGMTGYWDLKQGPRERNHCTGCHDPHSPAYPKVMPVFPPKPVIGEAERKPGAAAH